MTKGSKAPLKSLVSLNKCPKFSETNQPTPTSLASVLPALPEHETIPTTLFPTLLDFLFPTYPNLLSITPSRYLFSLLFHYLISVLTSINTIPHSNDRYLSFPLDYLTQLLAHYKIVNPQYLLNKSSPSLTFMLPLLSIFIV